MDVKLQLNEIDIIDIIVNNASELEVPIYVGDNDVLHDEVKKLEFVRGVDHGYTQETLLIKFVDSEEFLFDLDVKLVKPPKEEAPKVKKVVKKKAKAKK